MKLTTRTCVDGKTTCLGKPGVGSFFNSFYHLKILILRQALVDLSNGVLRDSRAFNMDNPDWLSQFKDQGILSY